MKPSLSTSATADQRLSYRLEVIREAVFVWDLHEEEWLDKMNEAIDQAKKLEAQQTDDTLSQRKGNEGISDDISNASNSPTPAKTVDTLSELRRQIADREARMRAAHRKISEMLHYEGLLVIDEENGFAEIVMDGLSLGPPDAPDVSTECWRCDGAGFYGPEGEATTCAVCMGTGKIPDPPASDSDSAEARKKEEESR